ncbi:hypothetical protein Tco_0799412 [Tanacetum coccineum]|uniref:Uncharacterized protein n=1 Tax=Tanacetum coccineum TaxID=301880 RepID=A0ABQ4ZQ94_9ASTR
MPTRRSCGSFSVQGFKGGACKKLRDEVAWSSSVVSSEKRNSLIAQLAHYTCQDGNPTMTSSNTSNRQELNVFVIDAAYAFRAEEMPSLISCLMAAKVMAGVSDVDVLLGGNLSTKDNTGYDKDGDNDANGGNG